METINEVLTSAVYFSLNPIAWAAVIVIAIRSRKLLTPVIAAITTQTLFSGLLISLIALSDEAFPVSDVLVLVLLPGVLSGIFISTLVIPFTKRRQLRRLVSSRQMGRLAYK